MKSITEQKVDVNRHLTGDFPSLPLPHPIGTAPKIFNRPPNLDNEIIQTSHKTEHSEMQIIHTESRLMVRNELNKEWRNRNLKIGTNTKTKHEFEALAKVNPTINASLNATPEELFNLAEKYFFGKQVEKDIDMAIKLLQQAADQGYSWANLNLGLLHYGKKRIKNYFQQDFKQAFICFEKSADQGCSKANYYLGQMYYKGQSVEKNFKRAASEMHIAAKQGITKAQFKLGYLYDIGKDVNQDFDQAIYWYKQAAERGNVKAQNNLGKLLGKIETNKQVFLQSAAWYQSAAEAGFKPSQQSLAKRYFEGKGVDKDIVKATYWELRSVLSKDGKNISLSLKKFFKKITLIPNILENFANFRNLHTLELFDFSDESTGQMGSIMAEIIRSTSSLTCIKAPTYKLNSAEAGMLMQSLATNTTVAVLELNFEGIDLENRRTTEKKDKQKKPLNIFGPENSLKHRLITLTQQNKDILELRTYLQNYLNEKPGQHKLEFDVLPSEIMMTLADQIIVTSLKKGISKQVTQSELDEFFLSAQSNSIFASLKN